MTRTRVRGGVAGLLTVGVLTVAVLGWKPADPAGSGPKAQQQPRRVRPEGKPIPMKTDQVGLEIVLGAKDKEPTPWSGDIQVSKGRVASLDLAGLWPQSRVQ